MDKHIRKNTKIRNYIISKEPPLKTLVLCLIGAFLNLVVSETTSKVFHIPLFLDTIFSITILFYCGFWPAVLCTLIFSVPSVILSEVPFYLLFNICSIVIFIITKAIMKIVENSYHSIKLTVLYLILAALLSGFTSSIIGGFIHTVGMLLNPTSKQIVTEKFVLSLFSQNGNLLLSSILGRIPTTCIDRIICTLLGYGLYKILSKHEIRIK